MTAKEFTRRCGGGVKAEMLLIQLFECGVIVLDPDMGLKLRDEEPSRAERDDVEKVV